MKLLMRIYYFFKSLVDPDFKAIVETYDQCTEKILATETWRDYHFLNHYDFLEKMLQADGLEYDVEENVIDTYFGERVYTVSFSEKYQIVCRYKRIKMQSNEAHPILGPRFFQGYQMIEFAMKSQEETMSLLSAHITKF